jgi:hypothetical protein
MHCNAKKYILLLLTSLSTLKITPNSNNQSVLSSLVVIKFISSFFKNTSKKSWFSYIDPSQSEVSDALTLEESNAKLASQFPIIKNLKAEIDMISNGNSSLNEQSFNNCMCLIDRSDCSSNGKLEQALVCLKANTIHAKQTEPAFNNDAVMKSLQVNNEITNIIYSNNQLSRTELADALIVRTNFPISTIPEINTLQELSAKIAYGQKDINIQDFEQCLKSVKNTSAFSTNAKLSQILRCLRANSIDITQKNK